MLGFFGFWVHGLDTVLEGFMVLEALFRVKGVSLARQQGHMFNNKLSLQWHYGGGFS